MKKNSLDQLKADFKRSGTIMLMLLLLVVVAGISALKIIPDQGLLTKRTQEAELNTNLSHLRFAFDIKQITYPEWDPTDGGTIDLNDKEKIQQLIDSLHADGFLRSAKISDPTIMRHNWGNNNFWKYRQNLINNSSFENETADLPDNWTCTTNTETNLILDTENFLWADELDDYPNQNKFGKLMSIEGKSLKITK